MKILVTGAFGFLGGRLSKFLQDQGHELVLASPDISRNPILLSKYAIKQIAWGDLKSLESACDGVDAVIHSAGLNAQTCANDPIAALEFNGCGTTRLLTAAINKKVEKFIYISTAHVYSNELIGNIDEYTCTTNLHPYATSHKAGEDSVLFASQKGKIKGYVVRLSNAFGAPMLSNVNCWMLLMNDLCKQVIETGKIALKSTGTQHRDFIPLTEVCRALTFLIENDMTKSDTSIVNIGIGTSYSIYDMAKLVQQRSHLLLKFIPQIIRPLSDGSNKDYSLTYQTNTLGKNDFKFKADFNAEIDNLLLFCKANFKAHQVIEHNL